VLALKKRPSASTVNQRDMSVSGLSLERSAQSVSVKPRTPGQVAGSDFPFNSRSVKSFRPPASNNSGWPFGKNSGANSRGWRPNGTRGSIFYLSRRYTIWEGGPPAVGAGFVTRNSSPTISNGRVCTVPSKFGYVLPSNRIVNVFLSSSTV
jgi:hypothetical protein